LKLEVKWLAYLATKEGMLDSAKCLVLKHALGPDADILAFGEKLYDRGYCSNFDRLQELVTSAYKKAEAKLPVPSNPFDVLKSTSPRLSMRPTEPTPSPLSSAPEQESSIELESLIPSESKTEPVSEAESEPATPSPILPSLTPVSRPKPSDARRTFTRPSLSNDSPEPPVAQAPAPVAQTSAPIEQAPNPVERPTTSPRISIRNSLATKNTPDEPPQVNPIHSQTVAPAPAQALAPAPAPAAAPVVQQSVAPEPKLSRERPDVLMEMPDEWPDFDDIESLSESAARQFLVQLLLKSQSEEASDLHLCADARPFIRRNRCVEYFDDHVLTESESEKLNKALLSEYQHHEFDKNHDLDYALAFDQHRRYRVNLMVHKEGLSGTYRLIPNQVKTLEELGFSEPETIKKLLSYHNGLIMVTGPLGSGKTATLAALIHELNCQRQDHLITVESPIEIVQQSNECHITQREVGSHTETYHSALKGALRQDPDIIVIGEMRDLETVEMAISASETGHLVIGTMHTSDAANTLNRLLDVFPAAQQTQIRSMVAESLKGIICQRLLPSTQGGVELAYELLLNNAAVGTMIRSNKADGLSNIIETSHNAGMVLMDKSIFALWETNRISDEVALTNLVSHPMKLHIRNSNQAAATA
jgi:twitching motility protein PilT